MDSCAIAGEDNRFRFSLRKLFLWMLAICILLAALKLLGDAVQSARREAIALTSQSPLNQLSLALQNYHDAYGQFPPAFIVDEAGRPMHSWRVLVLPFIEQQALYDLYDFSEPWNGPNNLKLAKRMPAMYNSASEPPSTTLANFVVIVGRGTAFPGHLTTSLDQFSDGRENTILLTEVADSKIPWTAPRDLHIDEMSFTVQDKTKPSISSAPWRQPYIVFADSLHAYAVSPDMPPLKLRALATIAGGESVDVESLKAQGHLR